ncbi:MAG: pantothenate kinase [Bacteroidaceae bacterium]|nr:pantothenate kinase [Bacteroidaceae bacterium]
MIKIGIDIGITSTKIAAVQGNEILFAVILREIFSPEIITDLLAHYGFKSTDVESISVTGVGQSKIKYPLLEKIPRPVGEFEANAAGAGFFYDLEKFIIVSMGTGTSFVKVENGEYAHLGGSALGGGTLTGLSKMVFHGDSSTYICKLADKGDLAHVDLHLDEVCKVDNRFPLRITASNIRKGNKQTSREDAALGLLNLVVQNIGVMAYFAGLGFGIKDFVCIGRVTQIPQCEQLLEQVSKLYEVNFHIPKYAPYITAIGAAVATGKPAQSSPKI